MDKNQGTFCVNVYNMSETYGLKIGDNVAIPEPQLFNVQVKYKHLVYICLHCYSRSVVLVLDCDLVVLKIIQIISFAIYRNQVLFQPIG